MVSVLGNGNWLLTGDGAEPAVGDRFSRTPVLRARTLGGRSEVARMQLEPFARGNRRNPGRRPRELVHAKFRLPRLGEAA